VAVMLWGVACVQSILCLSIILASAIAAMGQGGPPATFELRTLMSPAEYRAAGLSKLTQQEIEALNGWIVNAMMQLLTAATSVQTRDAPGSGLARSYEVEASANDETFVINGEVFKAQTYCFGVMKGDRVLSTEGNPLGACATAEFVVLRRR
jgi:purine nucleoside permease